MAVLETSGVTKKVLKNSYLEIKSVRCEMEETYKLATMVIGKFYQLKNDVEYKIAFFEVNGEVGFTKKRAYHIIRITADDLEKVTASVLYENIKTSQPVVAEQNMEGDYIITIPSSAVENTQNTFLKDGRLLIHIKFGESRRTLKRMHSCSEEREKLSEQRLSEDLKSLSIYSHETTITLHVDGQKILVPKGLLACRSKYFKEYPNVGNDIHLSTYYETVLTAVQYLHTGKIPNLEEMNGRDICRLLEVAQSLKIKSLGSKCMAYINQLVLQGDVERSGLDKENCTTS